MQLHELCATAVCGLSVANISLAGWAMGEAVETMESFADLRPQASGRSACEARLASFFGSMSYGTLSMLLPLLAVPLGRLCLRWVAHRLS